MSRRILGATSLLALASILALVGSSIGQAPAAQNNGDKPAAGKPARQAGEGDPSQSPLPNLVKALKATPGCLGAETAQSMSGKQAIFAWFENKEAVEAWYYSDVHQGVMQRFAPDYDVQGPLEHVPDDAGPIMVIASITPASQPKLKEFKLPISQIAVELYAPLPGGAAPGGRFAPAAFKVPHLREYQTTPPEEKPADRAAPQGQ